MKKYYTRRVIFIMELMQIINKKKITYLCGNKNIAFDQIEIFKEKKKFIKTINLKN